MQFGLGFRYASYMGKRTITLEVDMTLLLNLDELRMMRPSRPSRSAVIRELIAAAVLGWQAELAEKRSRERMDARREYLTTKKRHRAELDAPAGHPIGSQH